MHEMWDLHTHFKHRIQKYVGDVALVRDVMHSPLPPASQKPFYAVTFILCTEKGKGACSQVPLS